MKKIVKRKLSDDVVEELFKMIEAGDYAPGEQFPSERELMALFSVGRPAIREALQYLHNVGLITVSHGQRPTVKHPTALGVISQIDLVAKHLLSSSPDSLEYLKDARLFFEAGMVRKAAELAMDDDIENLEKIIDKQQKYYHKDREKFINTDLEFHVAIASITNNPIFVATSQAMLGWLKKFYSKSLLWEGNEHYTLEEHKKIIHQIKIHSTDGAVKQMQEHLNRSTKLYRFDQD